MKFKISILTALAFCLSLSANAQLNSPEGLAFDGSGHLWVANGGANDVLELNATTGAVLNTITNGVNGPSRLFFANGYLWVLNTAAGTITSYNNLTTAGGKLVETITIPTTVTRSLGAVVDAFGDVYISGSTSNNVIALNVNGGLIETLTQDKSAFAFNAPDAMVIHGEDIYVSFGPGTGTNAVISYNGGEFLTNDPKEINVYNDGTDSGPTGIAFDADNNVYISEYYSGTIVKFALGKGKTPLLVISNGTANCEGVAVDASGNIYSANSSLNNITVYSPTGGAPIRTLN
jgi:sugar lactone lactonase YvrE